MDRGRIISVDEVVYVNSPLEGGGNDDKDASCRLFS